MQLLTRKEAEKIVQVPLKPGRLSDDRSYFQGMSCQYLPVQMFEKGGSATLSIDTTANMKATDSIFGSAKEQYGKELYAHKQALARQHKEKSFTRVEGLGDDAFFTDPSLTILDGDTHIVIRASGGPKITAKDSETFDKKMKARNLELSKKIAKEVLKKLGRE